ncbi:RNA 2',3'-cyclic phosphodiesterase [Corynebacterium aquatimens]|uniref:RNA 2',3'-cyclic phosphodiesterase n=1 Tax=Corynebacterium aquatimens TaxID=1190508 RepID=A0A931E3P5_9CORY|nr:RNA 2',3'-cyclic phosphodiesterase [Corynebacterium aquatimens]MBG6121923.1 2'-5' RNA ligase [Corynebacterium aquatimens]WJY65539.1 2',5' RNA ligase family [Corynebacterium aquatimens]
MKRLFAALTPPDNVREHLVTALRPIRDLGTGPQLRWTDPDNWHVTLAFYGSQPNDVGLVTDVLAQATAFAAPLNLQLRGAGCFDSRTLWIGVGGDAHALKNLMADCLIDPNERHRQRSHLTVARTSTRTRDAWLLDDHAHALSVYQGPEFVADEVHLLESHLGKGRSGGPRYEVIDTFYLRS